jgi:hypothetical protein
MIMNISPNLFPCTDLMRNGPVKSRHTNSSGIVIDQVAAGTSRCWRSVRLAASPGRRQVVGGAGRVRGVHGCTAGHAAGAVLPYAPVRAVRHRAGVARGLVPGVPRGGCEVRFVPHTLLPPRASLFLRSPCSTPLR